MAAILVAWQPSALAAACPSTATYVAGVRTLHNSIGTPVVVPTAGAAAEGAAMSAGVEIPRNQRLGADQAKGFNARGNPPRGRRRV